MLEYYLEPNLLTDAPEDFRAQVVNVRSFSTEDIIERIMGIGAGLTRSDILSVFEAEKQVCAAIVAEGGAINTELWSAHPSIQGVFTATAEPDAHTVRLNLNPGKVLRDAIAGMRTKKVPPVQTGTIIESVTDVKTGSISDKLTPNRDLRISGTRLKVAGDHPDVGVYFLNTANGVRTKVDPTDMVENNPSSLLVVIPGLTAGAVYHVQVVTQYTGNKQLLAQPRTATFDKPLTAEGPAGGGT